MSELISKEQAMAYPLSYEHYDKVNGSIKFINGVESYREYIDGLPTVEERKHGHWERRNMDIVEHPLHCTRCGWSNHHIDRYVKSFKLCPDCGAIMDEVSKDAD